MIYQVNAKLYFAKKSDAEECMDFILLSGEKSMIINVGKVQESRGEVELLRCRHDTIPNKPCTRIKKTPVPQD